jgi:hypothetical protein
LERSKEAVFVRAVVKKRLQEQNEWSPGVLQYGTFLVVLLFSNEAVKLETVTQFSPSKLVPSIDSWRVIGKFVATLSLF